VGGFGIECAIGVTGLEFLLLGALAPGSEALFLTVDFFWKRRFQRWANLPSSVSGLEVRQVGVWARTIVLWQLVMEQMGRLAMKALLARPETQGQPTNYWWPMMRLWCWLRGIVYHSVGSRVGD
jgi:hypothetical protein